VEFKVGLAEDLSNGKGGFSWGEIAIEKLSPLHWEFLEPTGNTFKPEILRNYQGVAFAAPAITADSFPSPKEAPLVMARFGVGYDNIDLAACTRAGTVLTITPDGSKKPVATAALMLTLVTMHRLLAKNVIAKAGRWNNRLEGFGQGLNGKTVATIGLGNIGAEFFRLIEPFDCKRISYDPWKTQSEADQHHVTLVDLPKLLQIADVIVVLATLTPDTKHLINNSNIKLMKSNAVLINISRGPIVEETALIKALEEGNISGAGLDVFETEPPSSTNPLLLLPNVVVTPHNIAWTDELAFGMGSSAFNAINLISSGKIPPYVVNSDVLTTPQFLEKLELFK